MFFSIECQSLRYSSKHCSQTRLACFYRFRSRCQVCPELFSLYLCNPILGLFYQVVCLGGGGGCGGYTLFSSIISLSFHYSTYISSIFFISYLYSTYFSSAYSISFHYSTWLSSIFSTSFHYSTCLSSIFSIFFHYATWGFFHIFPTFSLFNLLFFDIFPISFYNAKFKYRMSIRTGSLISKYDQKMY